MQDIYMGSIGDWTSTWKRFIVGFKQTNENRLTKFPDLKIAESCESIKEYHMFVLLSSLSYSTLPGLYNTAEGTWALCQLVFATTERLCLAQARARNLLGWLCLPFVF